MRKIILHAWIGAICAPARHLVERATNQPTGVSAEIIAINSEPGRG